MPTSQPGEGLLTCDNCFSGKHWRCRGCGCNVCAEAKTPRRAAASRTPRPKLSDEEKKERRNRTDRERRRRSGKAAQRPGHVVGDNHDELVEGVLKVLQWINATKGLPRDT